MSDRPLFTYSRAREPDKDGFYECLIHDDEAGDLLYIEVIEFKERKWNDFAEIVGWRPKLDLTFKRLGK